MVVIASTLEAVTVYARGARITRIARVAAPVPARVRVAGLPLAVVDDSVRVEVVGRAVATSLRVAIESPATSGDAADEEPADLRAARQRLALAEAELERVDAALAQVAAAPLIAADPTDDPPAAWDAVVAARMALVAVRAARELALREAVSAARATHDTARLAFELLVQREARATSARAAKLHELRKAVEIDLVASEGAGDGDIELRLEYQVRAARWAPSYVARLDEHGARVELRAVVAQRSGEDWLGARLVLSTAEPAQLAELPELSPQRIGRRQDAPARRGFRAPPSGAEALYADFDRTRARGLAGAVMEPVPPAAPPPPRESLADEVWDDTSSRDKEAFATPPMGNRLPIMPMQYAAASPMSAVAASPKSISRSRGAPQAPSGGAPPAPAPQRASAEQSKKRDDATHFAQAYGGGVISGPRDEPAPEPAASVPRLDYGDLRMAPAGTPLRGRLIPARPDPGAGPAAAKAREAADAIAQLPLPRGCSDAWAHTYDYAFAADGRVDVASDGAWHSLAITAKPATAVLRHVAVPREQPDVFRVASISSPFDGPLLAGPIDVYDRGQFLVTSEVDATPPRGKVEIGLGVDAQVKVARNTEFREEATGMLRGGLRLVHGITIDVENLSTRPIDLEVRERVPVSVPGDDTVEVAVVRVEPAWERWTPDPSAPADARLRGGHRWRVAVPPNGGKAALRAGYEIKIASKLEIIGGNRRES